ncbi:MAG TPA: Obg family GTPase CgtA [Thermoanaerobaculia bacterium]|nr:Obg family GTPase CgtA [Thermoanaerobaculia bacterium]
MIFLDEAAIHVRGGRGGNGCVAFRREKYVPRGGPSGGDGGHGGSVWLVGDPGRNTLYHLQFASIFQAERGRHGEGSNRTGRSGADLAVPVPLGTVVYERDGGALLGEIVAAGGQLLAAGGGRGGRGNARFATATNQAPRNAEPGEQGEERRLRLELKLLADVGVVGLPNAGKSTLISAISAARPKIADYPFTTLVPQLGVVAEGPLAEPFVIADLPGLIAGAAQGAGLGIQFLRHVERCRLLVHLVDLSQAAATVTAAGEGTGGAGGGGGDGGGGGGGGGSVGADVTVVERELGAFDPALLLRPRLIVGSKLDAALPERLAELPLAAAARGLDWLAISSATRQGLDRLVATLSHRLQGAPAGTGETAVPPRGGSPR